MSRFFVAPEQISGERVIITGPDVIHISRVLRLGAGDTVTVLDGAGRACRVRLTAAGKDAVEGLIIEEFAAGGESPLRVTLLQGLAKGDKMEMIIQKCTELGVAAVVPLHCRRSVARLEPGKARQRRERWQRVAMEAAKQCRRAVIPRVTEVMSLPEALELIPPDALAVMPYEMEKCRALKQVLRGRAAGEVYLLIGPEGGFEPLEVDLATGRGVIPVSLGPRILRTETAGPAALAMVLYELGDLGGT
ncbi:16S rRNA (uracil(1498)-N(3))-methyltransferase [Desulfotomaculum copahuensis]|uniref:Ribosomal RNA small subunit methyltransferase E n=1 Tax=Desulfotomaculum copahuensis TaxID=1838280 RepID=A0A1B7LFH2_9FIRM|nr:16S rRNA (uracil(1498)-N(3))-methyltransferase [Desulfotomaculum copahuensis]OAT82390.1 16S rRNA methyltransferase [Desulfotomaculum copahuensis]